MGIGYHFWSESLKRGMYFTETGMNSRNQVWKMGMNFKDLKKETEKVHILV